MNANTIEYPATAKARTVPNKKPPIPVKCRQRNRFIPAFLIGVVVLSVPVLATSAWSSGIWPIWTLPTWI